MVTVPQPLFSGVCIKTVTSMTPPLWVIKGIKWENAHHSDLDIYEMLGEGWAFRALWCGGVVCPLQPTMPWRPFTCSGAQAETQTSGALQESLAVLDGFFSVFLLNRTCVIHVILKLPRKPMRSSWNSRPTSRSFKFILWRCDAFSNGKSNDTNRSVL